MLSESLLRTRDIRIFISSTFLDLKKERMHLINHVFPVLREYGKMRGINVTMLDLRWGITPTEKENGKVLETCLDEIKNSRPFFIGILGNRYGWCPKEDQFTCNKTLAKKYPWIKADVQKRLSCTEIEIQYGVLRNHEKMNAIFFYKENCKRNPGGKVSRLIKQIANDKRYPLIPYTSIEKLGEDALAYFKGIINGYPSVNDAVSNERWRLYSDLTRCYQANSSYINELDSFMSSDLNVLEIHGSEGSGKSSLIAYWLKQHLNRDGTALMDGRKVLWLENESDLFFDLQTIQSYTQKNGLLIILDQNLPYQFFNHDLPYHFKIKDEYSNLKIITTIRTNEDEFSDRACCRRSYKLIRIKGFGDTKEKDCLAIKKTFLNNYLDYKDLEPSQIKKIIECDLTTNPSIMRTLVDELNRTADSSNLQNIENFLRVIIKYLYKDYNCIGALALLATEKNGLSESELIKKLTIKPLHWASIYLAIKPLLKTNNDGKITIKDNRIRCAIMNTTESFRFLIDYDERNNRNKKGSNVDHLKTYWNQDVDTEDVLEFGDYPETGFHYEMVSRYLSCIDNPCYDWEALELIGYYIKNRLKDTYSSKLFFHLMLEIQKSLLPKDSEYFLHSIGPLTEMGIKNYSSMIFRIIKDWPNTNDKLYWLLICVEYSNRKIKNTYIQQCYELISEIFGKESQQMIDFLIWITELNMSINKRKEYISLVKSLCTNCINLNKYRSEEIEMIDLLSKYRMSRVVLDDIILLYYYNRNGSKKTIRTLKRSYSILDLQS